MCVFKYIYKFSVLVGKPITKKKVMDKQEEPPRSIGKLIYSTRQVVDFEWIYDLLRSLHGLQANLELVLLPVVKTSKRV